jgi:hypothetical protein
MASYWVLTSQVGGGGMAIARENLSLIRYLSVSDYYAVSSTPTTTVTATGTVLSESCHAGGSCYYTKVDMQSISTCSKNADINISWRIGERYPTSSVGAATYLLNQSDLQARGDDCLITPFSLLWSSTTAAKVGRVATSVPAFLTGVDVLDDRLYIVASSVPQFRIYRRGPDGVPIPIVTSTLLGNRLNAIDVIRDPATGRRYAFMTQHTKTDQLLVVDVTNDIPVIRAARSLYGTDQLGSFPQGWRVLAYGNRLYVTSRETAGAEFHIFSISDPTAPAEIPAAAINLGRTVNDMVLEERRGTDGVLHRYLVLATSAALKELSILEVTNDVPTERLAIDLPGTENALSVAISDNDLFLGRQVVSSGPELYHYVVTDLLQNHTTPLSTSEVGTDVHTLRAVGNLLFLGTNKSGSELQLWQQASSTWSVAIPNSGRIAAMAAPKLAPLGVDLGTDTIATISQSVTQVEQLISWSVQ